MKKYFLLPTAGSYNVVFNMLTNSKQVLFADCAVLTTFPRVKRWFTDLLKHATMTPHALTRLRVPSPRENIIGVSFKAHLVAKTFPIARREMPMGAKLIKWQRWWKCANMPVSSHYLEIWTLAIPALFIYIIDLIWPNHNAYTYALLLLLIKLKILAVLVSNKS